MLPLTDPRDAEDRLREPPLAPGPVVVCNTVLSVRVARTVARLSGRMVQDPEQMDI